MATQITVSTRKPDEILVQFAAAEDTRGQVAFSLRDALPGIARAWRVLAGDIAVSSDNDEKPSWVLFDYRKPRVKGGVRYVKAHLRLVALHQTLAALVKHGMMDAEKAASIAEKAEARGVSATKPFLLAFDEQGRPVEKWGGWRGWQSYAVAIALLFSGEALVSAKPETAEAAWLKYAGGIREDNYRVAIAARVAWRQAQKGITTMFTVADAETGATLGKRFPSPEAAIKAAALKGWKKAALTAIAKVGDDWQTMGSQVVEVAAS